MKGIIKQKMYGFLVGAVIGAVFSCPSFVWAQAKERAATMEVIKMDAAEMGILKDKRVDLSKENPELFKEVTSELKESVSKGELEFTSEKSQPDAKSALDISSKEGQAKVLEIVDSKKEDLLKSGMSEADITKMKEAAQSGDMEKMKSALESDNGKAMEAMKEVVGKEEVTKEFIKDVEVRAKEAELKDQGVSEKDAQEKAVKEEVASVEKEVAPAEKEIAVKEVAPVEHDNVQDTRDQQQQTADEGKFFDNPTDAQAYADSISGSVHDHGTDVDSTQRYHVHPAGT